MSHCDCQQGIFISGLCQTAAHGYGREKDRIEGNGNPNLRTSAYAGISFNDGDGTITESKVSEANREKLEAEKIFLYMEATREGINLGIEQGIWVAMMIDMWAITGKVPVNDENGEESFLGSQRRHMVNTLNFLTDTGFDVGLFGVDVPNPLGYIFSWLRPLKTEMEKKIMEPSGTPFVPPGVFWRPLDPIPRMLVIFMIPAILRMVMNRLGSSGLLGA